MNIFTVIIAYFLFLIIDFVILKGAQYALYAVFAVIVIGLSYLPPEVMEFVKKVLGFIENIF